MPSHTGCMCLSFLLWPLVVSGGGAQMNCHSPPGRSHLTTRLPPTYPPTTSPPPPQPQRDFTFHTLLSLLPPLHLTPSLPPLTVVHRPFPQCSPPARLLVGHPLRARAATILVAPPGPGDHPWVPPVPPRSHSPGSPRPTRPPTAPPPTSWFLPGPRLPLTT